MFSGMDINLYIKPYSAKPNDRGDEYKPGSFILINNPFQATTSIQYVGKDRSSKDYSASFKYLYDDDVFKINYIQFEEALMHIHSIKPDLDLNFGQLWEVTQLALNFMGDEFIRFFNAHHIAFYVCKRSDMKKNPERWKMARQCLLVLEDCDPKCWRLFYVNRDKSLQAIDIESVDGLSDELTKLAKTAEELNQSDLIGILSTLSHYKNRMLPLSSCALVAVQLLNDIVKLTEDNNKMIIELVSDSLAKACKVDWGVEDNVIDDVAIYFLVHLQRRVKALVLNGMLDEQCMKELILINLFDAVIYCHEFKELILISLFDAMKYCHEDFFGDMPKLFGGKYTPLQISLLEKKHLKALRFDLYVDEKQKNEVLTRLKIAASSKKPDKIDSLEKIKATRLGETRPLLGSSATFFSRIYTAISDVISLDNKFFRM